MSTPAFSSSTTAADVATRFAASIAGKVILVTGTSPGGLGAETARVAALHNPRLVILAGRDQQKLDETEAAILKETPSAPLRKLLLDLSSFALVRRAAVEVNAYAEPIDVLINNAGAAGATYSKTVDGFESCFATNHLGHFLFTNLIRPRLLASARPRVVNVSSGVHRACGIKFDDFNFSDGKTFVMHEAYAQSKTANIHFTVALHERWGIDAFAPTPGLVATGLSRSLPLDVKVAMGLSNPDGSRGDGPPGVSFSSLGEGTASQVVAAFDPALSGQSASYILDCKVANDSASPEALDKGNAERLWALSEECVGETFA